MKAKLIMAAMLLASVLSVLALSGCKNAAAVKPDEAFGAYDTEADWNGSQKIVKLGYQESPGETGILYCTVSGAMRMHPPPGLPTGAI